MLLQLLCLRGPLAGKIFPLGEEGLLFGRDPTSTIKIANKLASRRHAEVRHEETGFTLYDRGSQNGTFVNGVRVTSHLLRPNDEIVIGSEVFRVEMLMADSTIPTGPQIICRQGPLAGKIFPLGEEGLLFGRDPTSTIKIGSKLASRRHAEVRYEDAGFTIYDLGSQNGTLVNGVRVTSHPLCPGDEIIIGNEVFQFDHVAIETDSTDILLPIERDNLNGVGRSPSTPPEPRPQPTWEPLHVTLEFGLQEAGGVIRWHCPIIGERITTFTPPYTAAILPLVIRALDGLQYPDHPHSGPKFTDDDQATLAHLGLWQGDQVARDAYKIVGQALYAALGSDGQHTLDTMRNYSIDQRRAISYILRFPQGEVGLATLPWELLSDHRRPLLIGRGTAVDSCERYLNLPYAVLPPVKAGKKIHLLAILPTYGIPETASQEEREIRLKIWSRLRDAGLITFDEITPLTRRALNDYLRTAQRAPDIIHYFGHGTYRDGEGYLFFDDERNIRSMVSASQLAALLGDVRLVIIHACQSAMLNQESTMLSGVAPALSLVTGAVVGMQFTVRIPAATRFMEVFYDTLLAKRRSLQEAVAEGRQTLFFEEQDGVSWFVPTLYIRSREQRPVYLVQ